MADAKSMSSSLQTEIDNLFRAKAEELEQMEKGYRSKGMKSLAETTERKWKLIMANWGEFNRWRE